MRINWVINNVLSTKYVPTYTYLLSGQVNPLASCCHMGTAIKHTVPDRVKPSFVIFDIWALWAEHQSARMSKITNDGLTRSGTE